MQRRWLDTGVDQDPDMRMYLQDAAKPAPHHDERKGRWLGITSWPATGIKSTTLHFNGGQLGPVRARKSQKAMRSVLSPQTTGLGGGEWCAYGLGKISPELALDQLDDDGGSMVFDGAPLRKAVSIVGRPVVRLRIAADQPQALIAVRLNDVRQDGTVARVTYGLLNLAHRDSHAKPRRLKPGTFYDVQVQLKGCAQVVPAGHRLRIAVSTSYWPMVWPSPKPARVTVDPSASSLEIPLLKSETGFRKVKFAPVQYASPLKTTATAPDEDGRWAIHDIDRQEVTFVVSRDDGSAIIDDIGTEVSYTKEKLFSVGHDDPLASTARAVCSAHYRRGKWDARVETETSLTADNTHFHLTGVVRSFDRGKPFVERIFDHSFKRDCL